MVDKPRSPTPSDIEPRAYNVAGINVHVWGMDRLSPGREVAAMFFLHGRTSSMENSESKPYVLITCHLLIAFSIRACPPNAPASLEEEIFRSEL
jgi:hypothetical protein